MPLVVHDGPRDAPPLLLLHGSGFSGASFDAVVPELAAHHHVIRVDRVGGDVPTAAAEAAAVLDGLGLRGVPVAGHSSGGYVATALAEQRPELVRSLALVSTGPSLDTLLPQPWLLRALLAPPIGPILWPLRSDAMIRRGISVTCARPVSIPSSLVSTVRGVPYRAMRTVLRRNGDYITARSVPDRLRALSAPVLVVFGAADPRWDPAVSAARYESVPTARVERLPGVGHIPMLEAPEATAALLLEWSGAVQRDAT
ncbi:alpha/beta hydrolase [Asanoa sp. WMMD1127]|uniref:alpha/beta fold hydrolase n=1 Tax=Asanoa sp. WMMD1127 TaxID=3016107 RepID=UPI002415B1AB|nr:alpha/beta hydrolase [Asanoa sp. WMMD1127]MDG4826583.1 alpha/beta hydrolase [Asanoa sp. WMMD1127]